jgi:hypothetical protein
MNQAIASILAVVFLAACDGTPPPSGAPQVSTWRLTREGAVLERNGKPQNIVLPGWIWVDEPHCPPDLAVGPEGEAVITSNVIPTLWRVDLHTLAVSLHPIALDADNDKDVGFSALAYSPEYGAYFAVSAAHRSVWRIDAGLTTGRKLGAPRDWNANVRTAQRSVNALTPCLSG